MPAALSNPMVRTSVLTFPWLRTRAITADRCAFVKTSVTALRRPEFVLQPVKHGALFILPGSTNLG